MKDIIICYQAKFIYGDLGEVLIYFLDVINEGIMVKVLLRIRGLTFFALADLLQVVAVWLFCHRCWDDNSRHDCHGTPKSINPDNNNYNHDFTPVRVGIVGQDYSHGRGYLINGKLIC